MPYDRYGRTPEMARRDRIQTWLSIAALGLMVAGIFTCATLIVAMLS